MAFDGMVPAEAARRERWIGLLCAFGFLAISAAYILVTRVSVRTNFAPPDLLALRVGIGGVIMLPWFLRLRLGHLGLGQATLLAMTGGLGFGALSFTGFVLAPVAHASALQTGALSLYTAVLAMLFVNERFGVGKLIGLGLIVLGVALMGYDSITAGAPGQWRGDVLYSGASFVWAVFAVFSQRWDVRPVHAAAVVYVISAILYLPVYVIAFTPKLLDAPLSELAVQALLQGVFANLGTMVLFTRVTQAFGATSSSMLTAAAALIVPAIGIVTLGERPSVLAWVGVVCVTVGVITAVLVVKPRKT